MLVLEIFAILFGFVLSISNGRITFFVNVFYFAVYLLVIVFNKRIKKLNGLSVPLGAIVSILTFGGKELSDYFILEHPKISLDNIIITAPCVWVYNL